MHYLVGVVGLIVFLLLAWLPSNNRRMVVQKAPWIALLLVIQFAFGLLLMRTGFGKTVIDHIRQWFNQLLLWAYEGTSFVFGTDLAKIDPETNTVSGPFLLSVLMPIVFISALIGILQWTGILPLVIRYLGLVLSRVSGMGKLESFNAVASMFIGQSEVFISIKKLLPHLPQHRLYTLCASAMSTVSMSIVGAYMTLIDAKFVVVAIVLNLFGAFVVVSLLSPYRVTADEDELMLAAQRGELDGEAVGAASGASAPSTGSTAATADDAKTVEAVAVSDDGTGDGRSRKRRQSFFEMLGEYILDGFKVAFTVAAMLIGFIALLAMLNGIFDAIFGMKFQDILGYAFSPLAYLTGVPWGEAHQVGNYMATKLVSNEFVAMTDLSKVRGSAELSPRAEAIASTFLVSFANFSSIGIIAGAVKSLDSRQGDNIARFGLKLVYGATLVSFISATIVGLIY